MTDKEHFLNLTNSFLVAMPSLESEAFDRTLVYVCEHTPSGAVGVIVNRPMDIELHELLRQLDIETDEQYEDEWVYQGGPVQPNRGFILHTPDKQYESTINNGVICLTHSRDILQDFAHETTRPKHSMLCLGYAGWDQGQLEKEVQNNAWLTVPACLDLIFTELPHLRYRKALAQLGIQPEDLSSFAGHA